MPGQAHTNSHVQCTVYTCVDPRSVPKVLVLVLGKGRGYRLGRSEGFFLGGGPGVGDNFLPTSRGFS